ncbi:MAG: beta-glucosidase [Actinomycetota bacterium]|nr:beta-glucosidase [Actinomycetota bacterium]
MYRPHLARDSRRHLLVAAVLTVPLAATGLASGALAADTGRTSSGPSYTNASLEVTQRVEDLLGRMGLDEKIGQMTQAERQDVTSEEVARYRIGSVLSGGGSVPAQNTVSGWSDLYDDYQRAAMSTPLRIPMMYGVDAVHGHNNLSGATVFPHNIGLGATRDPALVEQVSRAAAEEVAATGIDWTFSPCLCVVRDDRWGRTYESFGETPDLVSSMASAVTGYQGPSLGGPTAVLATAKHYLGDGGTTDGVDQGDTQLSEAELRRIHLPPFKAAVERGVGSVMVSFSRVNGQRMHGNRYLLTDVLKGELGFSGIVVSDWAGIDQLDGAPGFTAQEVATAVNAGLDMLMVPEKFEQFITYLRSNVESGAVPMSRIDDAVRRILTKKFELGLFESPYTDRALTGTVGSTAHRTLAREAVRASQVLLKNDRKVLPLSPDGGKIFVAGKSADNIGNQSGGWTLTWQGHSGNTVPGTSILQGLRQVAGSGTTVTYQREGQGIDSSYRAAIAVLGETPYAEGVGDERTLPTLDQTDQATLNRLADSGVPVIVVLVSGRPMDLSNTLPRMNALVASWLPGTEGAGVADVLFGRAPATGKLPVTWPSSAAQEPINVGDGKTGLFPFGHGLSY